MDTTPKRSKRLKIARCMIRHGALNYSRPRTDAGQPVTWTEKRRCITMYETQPLKDIHRTNSDPDLFRYASRENLANDDIQESSEPNSEVFTAYGSHEDIRDMPNQLSVHDILTSFEEKNILKPIPKPRKPDREAPKPPSENVTPKPPVRDTPAPFLKELPKTTPSETPKSTLKETPKSPDNNASKPIVKPKPLPRPAVKSMSSIEKDTPVKQKSLDCPRAEKDVPIKQKSLDIVWTEREAPIKQKSLDQVRNMNDAPLRPKSLGSPVVIPRPPKILPKPNQQNSSQKPQKKEEVEPKQTSTSVPSTDIETEKPSNKEPPENGQSTRKRIKQKSTKTSDQLAYSVVDITDSTSPPLSPNDVTENINGHTEHENVENNDNEYDEIDEKGGWEVYLEPTDVLSDENEGENNENTPTVANGVSTPIKKTLSDKQTKGKRKDHKLKKAQSKSVDKKKKPPDFDRRVSLPVFHPSFQKDDDEHVYQDPDQRRASESDSRIYLSADEVVSPAQSDDECWNSDEFDTSSGGEEEEEEEEPIPKLPHLEGTKKKLYNIVTEILSTERAYVKRLHLLDQVFNKRLLEESKDPTVIPDKIVEEIFPYLSPIYKFHSTTLLPEIEQRIKEWETSEKIGDIFNRLGPYLLLYSEYVKNFDHATTTLNHWLRKSPRFASVVEELQKDPKCENLSLQHHMLEPVQRVPRYKLLLADYLKRLPEDSPDRKPSEVALVIISKAATNSNNSMKENEKFKKLLEIEDRIVDGMRGESLVAASRIFLKEGELIKLAARSGNRMSRIIILFNDMLMCCLQTPTGKLKVRQIMDLYHLNIVDNDPDLPEFAFRIKSKQKVLDLLTGSQEIMTEWVTSIRDAVNEMEIKIGSRIQQSIDEAEAKLELSGDSSFEIGQQAPPWVKDQFVSMCMLCASKFGVIHRKHHCRGCGRVVCGKCSNYNAKLAYAGDKTLRVCYSCAKKLSVIREQRDSVALLRDDKFTIDADAGSDMHGEVFWKAPGKEYKKEWLYLSGFVLYGQKRRQDVRAQFTVPVAGYEVEMLPKLEDSESPQQYSMKLHKLNKKEFTYYIASDNQSNITLWYNHLECAVKCEKYEPDKTTEEVAI